MAIFKLREPVETETNAVEVENSGDEQLAPGVYTFELMVIDNDGNVSAPARAQIVIEDTGPVAVIEGPARVPFGQSFKLSGERSHDIGRGRIVKYIWTLADVEQ